MHKKKKTPHHDCKKDIFHSSETIMGYLTVFFSFSFTLCCKGLKINLWAKYIKEQKALDKEKLGYAGASMCVTLTTACLLLQTL